MTALARPLKPMPGEPAHAFLSRLALRSGLSAYEFCTDMKLSFRQVINGQDEVLAAVAELAGCDLRDLTAYALRRENESYRLRGQLIEKDASRRARLYVCPACLRDDVRSSDLPRHQAAFVRATWLIDSIRTCPDHGLALVRLDDGQDKAGLGADDCSARIASYLSRLDMLAAAAPSRKASSLEHYLIRRIDSGGPAGSAWLDGLDFHAAAKICEMIGVVALFGPMPNLRLFTDAEWWAAGDCGFVVADKGPAGIREFLSYLQDSYEYLGPEGPQAVFGRLYQFLAFSAVSRSFDPVRALVAEHVMETMPMSPGQRVLGHVVKRRVVHSLRSAVEETGCHPKRLRQLLVEAGVITADSLEATVRFLFDAAADVLASLKDNMGLRQAGEYINAPRTQIKLIADNGFIKPIVERELGRMRAFARSELDRFLSALLQDAEPNARCGGSKQTIQSASHRANLSAVQIIQWILDRRLKWVGAQAETKGYLSVLVDVDEIKQLCRGAELPGVPITDLHLELGTSWPVACALLSYGTFSRKPVPHPTKKYEVLVVPFKQIKDFKSKYISLFQIANDTGCHHLRLKQILRESGVEPCLPVDQVKCTFYLQSEIERLRLALARATTR